MEIKDKIADELLHYLKSFSFLKDIKKITIDTKTWCPFTHGLETNESCYRAVPRLQYLILLLERYAIRFEYLDIDSYELQRFSEFISTLKKPELNATYKIFKENLKEIIDIIKANEKRFKEKVNKLTCEECIRLDEALNSLENHCYFSSVVMSVSSVEARLHYLFRKIDKKIYKKEFERSTLGQIVQVFDEKNQKYSDPKFNKLKKILPKKHRPLLELINTYRVYSAHPKGIKIDYKIAQSILNLSFSFLLDDEMKLSKKLTKHNESSKR